MRLGPGYRVGQERGKSAAQQTFDHPVAVFRFVVSSVGQTLQYRVHHIDTRSAVQNFSGRVGTLRVAP